MFKHLIFDFDGTIAESQEIVGDILTKLASKYQFDELSAKEIKHRSSLSLSKKIKLFFFIRRVDSEFKGLYGKNLKSIKPVNEILNTLAQLHNMGIKLSIISSNTKSNIDMFFKMNDIDFIHTIISVHGLFGKHKAIGAHINDDKDRREVLYVGDEIRDIIACKKAKVDIAFAKWGLDGNEDITSFNVKYILAFPSDLINIINA